MSALQNPKCREIHVIVFIRLWHPTSLVHLSYAPMNVHQTRKSKSTDSRRVQFASNVNPWEQVLKFPQVHARIFIELILDKQAYQQQTEQLTRDLVWCRWVAVVCGAVGVGVLNVLRLFLKEELQEHHTFQLIELV